MDHLYFSLIRLYDCWIMFGDSKALFFSGALKLSDTAFKHDLTFLYRYWIFISRQRSQEIVV